MDIKDARRLNGTVLLAAFLLLLWLVFLALDDKGSFDWGWPTSALQKMPFSTWMWLGTGTFMGLLAIVAFITYGVPSQPPGFASGSMRQVQCDSCKAVFFLHDTGHRPLEHQCPGCKALGFYDGNAAPVGEPPKAAPPKQIVQLGLTCRTCDTRFTMTDTGIRPMRVTCPRCKAVGTIR